MPSLDSDKCIGCGLCVTVCPDQAIELVGKVAQLSGRECMGCCHCQAVCPAEAISVLNVSLNFVTFSENEHWLPFGGGDISSLVRLMRSRRSCRNFTDEPVARPCLEDLVKIGTTAPSGTNSQAWTFTILDCRKEVIAFGDLVAAFFRKLNKMAQNPVIRFASKLFYRDKLGDYYRKYYPTVSGGLREWEEQGRDRLFHGASAVILVGAKENASCPAEDALLATQNILLAAHTMGLGTCLIGFAVEAIKHDPSIKLSLGASSEESIFSVIALGYPDEAYRYVCGRKVVSPRYPSLLQA